MNVKSSINIQRTPKRIQVKIVIINHKSGKTEYGNTVHYWTRCCTEPMVHNYVLPPGVDLLGNLPEGVCQKVREMGLFLT